MDSSNLKTASTYLNNLLLARGLLRNGVPIEFAHPSKGEGGKEATMASIINLVHDLILRRDKEQHHQATLAQTLRTLRTESSRSTATLERLRIRNEDLARQLSLAQSQERAARTALRTAESSARALREEMLRLKTTVGQVRASCANDVRKRDVQIQKLKTHLTAQQRGNKSGLVGASITIVPGVTSGNTNAAGQQGTLDVDDPDYNLKQETTEFLTQLSQSLSDENDNLIGLLRSTLITLKDLQGIPECVQRAALASQIDPEGNFVDNEGMMHVLPTSYETLAVDMDHVLENLRTLLTNPNFVPIEEVELREEEIMRLREGWEKMEVRWKEAIGMMGVWRKRLLNGGDTVNLDELKRGLDLGASINAFHDAAPHAYDNEDLATDEELDAASSSELDELDSISDIDIPDKDPGIDIFDLKLPRNDRPLKESSGNIKSPRKVTFTATQSGDTPPSRDENKSEKTAFVSALPISKLPQPLNRENRANSQNSTTSQRTSRKRHSSPHPDERSPKLTVQEKLNIAQAEAEAAAVLGGSKPGKRSIQKPEDEEPAPIPSPTRKTSIKGRPRRRKSTLSPDELELLLQSG